MGSTVGARMEVGTVEGTGALIEIGLEFTPRKVELYNVSALAKLEWSHPMVHGGGVKAITAGSLTYITADGVTPVEQERLDDGSSPGRGFTIGADADINTATEVIMWVAFE